MQIKFHHTFALDECFDNAISHKHDITVYVELNWINTFTSRVCEQEAKDRPMIFHLRVLLNQFRICYGRRENIRLFSNLMPSSQCHVHSSVILFALQKKKLSSNKKAESIKAENSIAYTYMYCAREIICPLNDSIQNSLRFTPRPKWN